MVQHKKPGSHRRTLQKDENTADAGTYAISKRSLKQDNYKLCSKDPPLTAYILTGSYRRYIVLTTITLKPDARWKFLSLFCLPVQGHEQRSYLGFGKHFDVDVVDPVSPPIVLFQADMQKEQNIHPLECTDSGNLYMAGISSGGRSFRQSCNRKYKSKSARNSDCLQNCFLSKNSSGSVYDDSSLAISEVLDGDIPKVNKPGKTNQRKKGKKKGKPYERSFRRKDYTEPVFLCERSICNVPAVETSVPDDPPGCDECISENKCPQEATSIDLPVQASKEISRYVLDPAGKQTECTLYSEEMNASEPTECSEFSCEGSRNQSFLDEVSTFQTCLSSIARTPEITLSTISRDTTTFNSNRSSSSNGSSSCYFSGKHNASLLGSFLGAWNTDNSFSSDPGGDAKTHTCIKEDNGCSSSECQIVFSPSCSATTSSKKVDMRNNCHVNHTHRTKDLSKTNNIIGEEHYVSQTSVSDTCQPSVPGKRGRHGRKISGRSNAARFGSTDTHCLRVKDARHSVWQRVKKNDVEEGIDKPQNSNRASRPSLQQDICQGHQMMSRNAAFVMSNLHGRGQSYVLPCLDEVAVQFDKFRLPSNGLETNGLPSETGGRKLVNKNVHEKSKRKPASVPKQDSSHFSRKCSHTGKTNARPSKLLMQHNAATDMSPSTGYIKRCNSGVKSPSNGGFEKVGIHLAGNAACSQLGPQEGREIMEYETAALGHIHCATRSVSQSQINPSSWTLGSLEKKCCLESNVILYRDSQQSACNLAGKDDVAEMKLSGESFPVEHSKHDQNAGPIVQKWVPVGKNDVGVLDTSNLDAFMTYQDELVSDNGTLENIKLGSDSPSSSSHFVVENSSSCSDTAASSVPEDGLMNMLGDHILCIENELNIVHETSNCCLTEEAKRQCGPQVETNIDNIVQVVNDAYKWQIASEQVYLATGNPVAEFERVLHSASPVIGQVQNIRSCKSCSHDKLEGDSLCRHQFPNISLGTVWQWYEKPGSYGLEVKAEDHNTKRLNNECVDFRAYFVPYLSAVQLFGRSKCSICSSINTPRNKEVTACKVDEVPRSSIRLSTLPIFSILLPPPRNVVNSQFVEWPSSSVKSATCDQSADSRCCMCQEEVLFEYFESDQPQQRQPLFEKIKKLVRGDKFSNCQIFGDPSVLECLNLRDIHPSSWYSVSWYPIYRIPNGNFRAAFLTYHSLGHFLHRSVESKISVGSINIISPVVGLQSYNTKGECWFQLRDSKAVMTESSFNPLEILKERLRTLEQTASVMARASVRKGDRGYVNRQPDYEFFLSRRW